MRIWKPEKRRETSLENFLLSFFVIEGYPLTTQMEYFLLHFGQVSSRFILQLARMSSVRAVRLNGIGSPQGHLNELSCLPFMRGKSHQTSSVPQMKASP